MTIKKSCVWLCLSGLGLLASTTPAWAWGSPSEVDVGFHVNCMHGGAKACLGPWFSYFPYDAYFQMPAPVSPYPNWPMPFPPAPQGMGQVPMAAPPVQPAGYGYPMQPPYWYGYGYGGYAR